MKTDPITNWIPLDAITPLTPNARPPRYTDRDLERASESSLRLRTAACRFSTQWEATYTCDHGLTKVVVMDCDADPSALPRATLALHAWRFPCACYRTDWPVHFGEPPTEQSLVAARLAADRWRAADPTIRVRFARRDPIRLAWLDPGLQHEALR
jgi:hypothetical protein